MNYQNDRESNEYRVARRSFTVIGFACAGVLALNYGLNAAVIGICGRLSGKGIIPEGLFAEGSLSRLLLVTLTGFGIALPLAAFAVKKLLQAKSWKSANTRAEPPAPWSATKVRAPASAQSYCPAAPVKPLSA